MAGEATEAEERKPLPSLISTTIKAGQHERGGSHIENEHVLQDSIKVKAKHQIIIHNLILHKGEYSCGQILDRSIKMKTVAELHSRMCVNI